ncbi:MAG: aminoacyl-histidine dipeptidase [Tannerella sp.]|jgi:dipeptidase D|nr:aminoacyl-histidine dipeptidase [Tannerella sp.]
MTINDLEPKMVWKFFHEITQIPRPSKKEGKIIEYIERLAASEGLAIKKDAAGNLCLSKPATKGYESLPTVILQAHLDMVCEKNSDVVHDFEHDPIRTVVDGEWLRAEGTTLGADNGIGVAAALAVIFSPEVEHGPIECLFTVDEETGLTGANALQEGFLTGKILLNLDSEDEGQIFVGCAGGKGTAATFDFSPVAAPDALQYFQIKVTGLNGGHSGCDIHKGLGNANKLLVRFLYRLREECDFTLAKIQGGNLHNAIAREASAVIGLSADKREQVRVLLNNFASDIENELRRVDPNVRLLMESTDVPATVLANELRDRLINSLLACPHGVVAMSHDIEGLVETSTNLASIKAIGDAQIVVETSQRSSLDSAKIAIADQVAAVFRLAGAKVKHGDGYPGWAPNPDSKILKTAQDSYRQLFGREPQIMAIHAGLECGLFLAKYPDMDMISFGPTMRAVHSPDERIEISTVALFWQHLKDVLIKVEGRK